MAGLSKNRKVPSDDEIHRRFWNDAQGQVMVLDEDAIAADWGVSARTVRYSILRLIESGRMVKPFKGSGLVVVDPDRWAGFRAEIHARSHIIDRIHVKLWDLGRKKKRREALHRIRVRNNNELATWVGQQVIIEMIREGRVKKAEGSHHSWLVVSPPMSYVSADRKMLHQGDHEKKLEVISGTDTNLLPIDED